MTPDALVFDLYGTLLDFTSLRERVYLLTGSATTFVELWRTKQIQYSFAATMMDRYVDFDQLTAHALDYAAAAHKAVLSAEQRADLIASWSSLPAHADVPAALAALQARGIRLAVLSNGSPAAIARGVESAGLSRYFDALLSVDTVRAYKPRPEVYHLAVERFQCPRDRIGFVSSNGWDATGAAEFGFAVYWCNRSGAPAETFGAPPAREIASLSDLVALVTRA
jgi:2-haloacid dehalogenase